MVIDKVGLIPIDKYIDCQSYKLLTKEMTIAYTLRNYSVDLEEYINGLDDNIFIRYDVYKIFNETNPLRIDYDDSRVCFQNHARNRYLKFYEKEYWLHDNDYLFRYMLADEVHHIYPLIFGGCNEITNLIFINKRNHDLLHNNPLENIEKYCHQAVDYLYYIYNTLLYTFIDKYEINKFEDNKKLLVNIINTYIEEEMMYFYSYIIKENGGGNCVA